MSGESGEFDVTGVAVMASIFTSQRAHSLRRSREENEEAVVLERLVRREEESRMANV
jgi:hypothetical protein